MHGLSTVATDKPEEWQIKTLGMAPFFGHNIFNNVVSLFEVPVSNYLVTVY